MEMIRGWAMGLCMAAMGCTLLQLLVPKNGMGKLFSVLLSAFFLCCLITPLLSIKGLSELSFDTVPPEVQDDLLEAEMNRQLKVQMEEAVQSVCTGVLASYGYALEKVEIKTDTSEDGYIYMDSVTVFVDKENALHAMAIQSLLSQRLGVSVEVRQSVTG